MTKNRQSYFETLSETVTEIHDRIQTDHIELDPRWSEDVCREHIAYGTVRTFDFPVIAYKGKPTRKYFHVCIYRDEKGRYELVSYLL
jgi:hypothetical protein